MRLNPKNIQGIMKETRMEGKTPGEAASFQEAPPPDPLPKKLCFGGDSGGEAASLREAPLPQTPSPEERLAFGGGASSKVVPPVRWRVSNKLGYVHGG